MSICEEQDWISALPDVILHHILSFFFTPVIDFPITPYQGITESQSIFIHKHFDPTPSLEFSLEFSVGTFWDHDLDVQHCIEFAISKQVQILSVIAHLLPEEHCLLPNMLYSHDNIRWLEHVSLNVLPFASLKTLSCFGNLSHVKKLGVNSWFCQFLAREYEVNNNGWKIFENLKVFAWFGPLEKECDLIALIDFLVHCPSLEKIEIDFRFSFWEEAGEHRPPFALERPFVENRGDGQPTVGFLDNVKKIIIHHFFGYKSEIEFIKHLMQKAVVHETLSLTYRRLEFNPESFSRGYTSCPPKELVQEEIFSLSTASSNVHISFHHTYHKLGF
ncbi:hypothetical protein GOBAR_AA31265 [Gossypium barbadense]|uniref:Uncharacterized protein n=1 Tax=Gossypium barbadense TaxID=3634 RepID=A0A2P5WEA6_GOSBA|nr:hypothetical protein GOBAR_AA31265 [Gossypium barbadense]